MHLTGKMADEDKLDTMARAARELAAELASDDTLRLEFAYQMLITRDRVSELERALEVERRKLDASLQTIASESRRSPLAYVVERVLGPLVFFICGMVVFAFLTLLLRRFGAG